MLLSLRENETAHAVPLAVAAAGGWQRLSPAAADFLAVLAGGGATERLRSPGDAAALGPEARRQVIRTAMLLVLLSEEPSAADHARLREAARALGVHEPAVDLIGAVAAGAVEPAAVRTVEFDAYRTPVPRELALLPAYARFLAMGLPAAAVHGTVPDSRLAAQFDGLRTLDHGTAGRTFAEFYAERGWRLPGTPGAVALPLTLHDWIHVYIGADTEPLGEVEVGAFASGTTRAGRGFHNLLIVLLMFEYGMVSAMAVGPGLAPTGALAPRAVDRERGRGVSGHPEGGRMVADALLRGRATTTDVYLGIDHLAHAGMPLRELRERYGIPARGTFASPH